MKGASFIRSLALGHAIRQSTDVGGIAAAAAAQVSNALCPSRPAELFEFPPRDLDGFEIIREFRSPGE
jgi:hypothetical protein